MENQGITASAVIVSFLLLVLVIGGGLVADALVRARGGRVLAGMLITSGVLLAAGIMLFTALQFGLLGRRVHYE